jgi:hypothetical protein
MKLKLEELMLYGNNLKVLWQEDIIKVEGYDFLNNSIILERINVKLSDIKPILKPLSDLTKEIEVNGEKFVPLEILGQKHIEDGFFEDGSFGWGQSTGGDDEQDYYLTVSNNEGFYLVFDIWCGHQDEGGYCVDNENIPFPLVELFFKWHFDVFGLIEKGLAINKNTL